MDLSALDFILASLAALAAGFINSLAGGGTLISFPVLVALGLPAVSANVTNAVALMPGYMGGAIAQRADLAAQKKLAWLLIPAAVLGGLTGSLLLLASGEKVFRQLVPWMISFACVLLAIGEPLKGWLNKHGRHSSGTWQAVVPVSLASVYGGFFSAGMSVIFLAILGLTRSEPLNRLNALKQTLSMATNIAAVLIFAFSGKVVWSMALIMMVAAMLGGVLGGKLAGRLSANKLRWLVVLIGALVAAWYFIRG